MDIGGAVTRTLFAGASFWLGLQLGEPEAVPPVPPIPANEIGLVEGETRAQLKAASARARGAWRGTLELQEAALERQLSGVLGPPGGWPDSMEEENSEDFFREDLLPGYIDQSGFEPRRIDCVSYPCIAVFAEAVPEAEQERFLDGVRGRNQLYRDWGKQRVLWQSEWGLNQGPDGAQWALMTWSLLPAEADAQLRQRTRARLRRELIEQRRLHGLVPGG